MITNKKANTINDLSDLRTAMRAKLESTPAGLKTELPRNVKYGHLEKFLKKAQSMGMLLGDKPVEINVFELIYVMNPCTMSEVISTLMPIHEPDDVSAAFRKLETNGLIEKRDKATYSVGLMDALYVPVRGKTVLDLMKLVPAAAIIKQPEPFVHNPDGSIVKEEGLDRCIWKFMQDCKPRLIQDIGTALSTYGFRPVDVKDRVILLLRKKWFNRTGAGKTTTYALKKHIKQPALETVAAPEVVAEFELGGAHSGVTPETTSSPLVAFIDKNIQERREAKEEKMNAKNKEATQQALPIAPQVFPVRGEGVMTAIWKLMSDHRPYRTSEVMMLLTDLGYADTTVNARMSELDMKKNWFDKTPVPGGRGSFFTLRKDIPMPVNEPAYSRRSSKPEAEAVSPDPRGEKVAPAVKAASTLSQPALAEAAAETKALDTTVKIRQQPDRSMGEAEVRVNLARVLNDKPAPLFERVSKISGVEFSEEEIEAVAKNLKDAGFGVGGSPAEEDNGLIKFDIGVTIKGVRYSTDLANQLAETLFANGYAKNVVS